MYKKSYSTLVSAKIILIIKITANQQSHFIKKHPSVLINSAKLNTLTYLSSVINGVIHTCICVQLFIYMFQISLKGFQNKRKKT